MIGGPRRAPRAGTAFVFSGAASRIAQELVLMKLLVLGRAFGPRSGDPLVPSIIAGSSSGALSAVALNAILQAEGLVRGRKGSKDFSWRQYEKLVTGLKNNNVYEDGGLLSRAMEIIREGAVLDTRPLRRLLETQVHSVMGYRTLGDLPIRTFVSVVERDSGKVHRLCSTSHPDLPLVDVLMASTAIPVAFPAQELVLPGRKRPVACIDGGIGVDGIPVDALREESCRRIFVVRPMKYDPRKKWNKTPPLARFRIVATAIQSFLYLQEALLENALLRAAAYARSAAYSYVPELPYNVNPLDFESGRDQLEATTEWAERDETGPAHVTPAAEERPRRHPGRRLSPPA
jgi:predicted acylesterase/phospholipase RssA